MNHHSYLDQERQYHVLNSISEIIQKNGLLGASNLSTLADRSIGKRNSSAVLLKAYDERKIPVFTSKLITRINVVHQQEINQINSTRTKFITRLKNEKQQSAELNLTSRTKLG